MKNSKQCILIITGFLSFFAAILVGIYNCHKVSLFLFFISYISLFIGSVSYKAIVFCKGVLLVVIGAFYVVSLSYFVGISMFDNNKNPIISVPDYFIFSYNFLVLIAGSSFAGTAGSVFANSAINSATDSIMGIEKKEINDLKEMNEKIDRIIVSIRVMLVMFAIFILFGLLFTYYFFGVLRVI